MNQANEQTFDERVLVLAPTAEDADLSRMFLTEAGFACVVCSDLCGLRREFEQGAGALLVTEEVLADSDSDYLVDALRSQPKWSDVPILLLTGEGADSPVAVWAMEMLGNVMLLERPVRVTMLVSALRTALKARRRQYELRNQMEALRNSEEQFRTLVNNSPDLIARLDPDLRHIFVSPAIERLAGLRPEEMLGKTALEIGLPEDVYRQFGEGCQEATRTRQPVTFEFTDDRTGSLKYLVSKIVPEAGPGGVVNSFLVMTTDITERKRIEQSLRDSEERYRATVEHAAVGVCNCAPDGRFVYANRAYCEIVGYSLEELLEMTWQELTPPDDREADLALGQRVQAGEMPSYTMEKRYVRKDGSLVWVSLSGSFVKDAEGRVRLGVGVIVDISDRKKAEDEARKNQEIFKLVHSIGKIGHWEWNSLTDENRWSPEIEALYGLPPGGFEGTYQAWAKMLHPDDLPRAEEDVRRALETGKYFTEFRVIWPDGSVHWLEARAKVFKDGHDKPVRIMGVNMDVTEQKRVEEALKEADRCKDEFLATLAHELRNPLAPIRNGLQLMRMSGDDPDAVEQARTMMDRQLTQLVRLVDDLMDVSRISQGKLQLRKAQVPLAAVVQSAVETSRPLIEQMDHGLTVTLPKQSVVVDADLTRLAQVFLNLLNNAAKYTERGGHIWLTAERQGSDVVASVKDTGIGIAADQLPRLFQMFTQADRGLGRAQGGLGIGLSLVKRLVEMHGGRIEAKSEGPGKGSEFVVRLPVVVEASMPQPGVVTGEGDEKTSLRILVVDDNRDGADSLSMMLKIMGNDTRTAYDGEEAVAATVEFQPDVILLDIGLPKLTGYEACRRIRQQPGGKELVIIAQTGWGQDEDRQRTHEAGFDHHMVKPVDPTALMKLLAGLQVAKG